MIGAGCLVGDGGPPSLSDDPGVIFSYPHDGQRDVPVGARVVVSFTDPIDPSALTGGCTVDANGQVHGGFCVRGPAGLVPDAAVILGPKDNVIHFESPGWAPATTYEVLASPALLWGKATNLHDGQPVLRFTTAAPEAVAGQGPVLTAVNGDDPGVFTGSGRAPRFPFVDFNAIRLVFSEPLDAATVGYGDSVRLVDGGGALVEAALLVAGTHVTIDPVTDLVADQPYRVELGAGLRDLAGDPLAATVLAFRPGASRVDGRPLDQLLSCIPGAQESYAAGSIINQVAVSAPLIGDAELAMNDSTLAAVMGNPMGFGRLIPLTLRKGQTLTMEALPVRLGGVIPAPLATGELRVTMASDATVYLTRNPFRAPDRLPDDALAPVHAYLAFDVVVTAADGAGNAALNQQVLGVQATGLASVTDGGLAIESVGALELDLLGLDRATTNMVLRLGTTTRRTAPVDTLAPIATATAPADGARGVAADTSVRVTFSEPIDPVAATRPGAVTLAGGTGAAVRVTVDGSTLVVTPTQPLAYATDYTLELGAAVRDLAGVAASPVRVRFRTEDLTTSAPAPLTLAAARPGVPCVLEQATATSPGRCRGSRSGDDPYQAFSLPVGQPVMLELHQPIDRTTATLGAACGAGSVRIERVDAAGACVAPVRGRLITGERTLRFLPDGGWTPATRYRVVLHGGDDDDCDAGELCGRNRLPLNGDVLAGIADRDDAGGADVVLPFVAAAADPARQSMTTRITPVADGNGNGQLDPGEAATDRNRAAMAITGTTGMIRSATLNGPDCVPSTPGHEACMYLSGTLPVAMGALQHDCEVGGQRVAACIPVELSPQIMYGTSLSMNADVAIVGQLADQRTRQLVLRLRTPGGRPLTGYIVTGPDGMAQLRATLPLYLDAPSMKLLAGLAGHDLESKPLTVEVAGPVGFTADGHIQIELANVAAVPLSVELSAIGVGIGTIAMVIPAGELQLQLVGDTARGGL